MVRHTFTKYWSKWCKIFKMRLAILGHYALKCSVAVFELLVPFLYSYRIVTYTEYLWQNIFLSELRYN